MKKVKTISSPVFIMVLIVGLLVSIGGLVALKNYQEEQERLTIKAQKEVAEAKAEQETEAKEHEELLKKFEPFKAKYVGTCDTSKLKILEKRDELSSSPYVHIHHHSGTTGYSEEADAEYDKVESCKEKQKLKLLDELSHSTLSLHESAEILDMMEYEYTAD